jgi:hypothetical protein
MPDLPQRAVYQSLWSARRIALHRRERALRLLLPLAKFLPVGVTVRRGCRRAERAAGDGQHRGESGVLAPDSVGDVMRRTFNNSSTYLNGTQSYLGSSAGQPCYGP